MTIQRMDEKDKEVCFSELFDDCFNYGHGIGSVLLKAVKDDEEKYSIDMITPLNYFPVYSKYNTRKILAYVEHQEFCYLKFLVSTKFKKFIMNRLNKIRILI